TITIGRRLYRSGESEYLLNLQPCRLKDIRELFLDTGVGIEAYSVIEQGKVDHLLQSSSTERRTIFEEAAGISKYKAHRKETQRKLERTQQNLLRAGDITDELEKRLRSVKLQAGKARRFQEYDLRLRELRAGHALTEFHHFVQDRNSINAQIAACSDRTTQLRAELARQEAEQSESAAAVLRLDHAIEERHQQSAALKARMTALQERARLAVQHQAEQRETVEALRRRTQQELSRIETIEGNFATEQAKIPELQDEHARRTRQLDELSARDHALDREITDLQATLEDEKTGLVELLQRSAHVHNEIVGLDRHRETLTSQKDRLQSRDGELRQLLEDALRRKAAARDRLAEVELLAQEQQTHLKDNQAAAQAARSAREQTIQCLAQTMAELSALRSRGDVLQDLEAKMEGVAGPVRELLQRKAAEPDHPRFAAIQGILADMIETDLQYTPVIEAALERWAQHLVISSTDGFLALNGDIETLKGRLHVLCTDRLSPIVVGRDFSGWEGYVCLAVDLVTCPEELEYLTRSLLGRTIVVETFEHALDFAGRAIEGYEFITLKGEVADSQGRMILGPQSDQTGLISRKNKLREIVEQQAALEDERRSLNDELSRHDAALEHCESSLRDLQNAIATTQSSRAKTQAELQHAQENIERMTREQPLINGEVELIEQAIAEAHTQSTAGRHSLHEIEAQNSERKQSTDSCQEKIEHLSHRRNENREALTDARVAVGQLAEKLSAVRSTIVSMESVLESGRESLQDYDRQIAQGLARVAESEKTASDAETQLTELNATLGRQENELLGLRREREMLRAAGEEFAICTKTLRTQLAEAEELLHAEEMKLREAEVRRDELCVRIKDELDIDLVQAYESFDPQTEEWQALEAEITELRAKISRLGNINLDAIGEQEELANRLEFLNGQHQDLEDSRRQLEDLIKRLNDESRDRFQRTFEEIRIQFQQLFRKLFGGGKADLVLDPECEDVLEAGIDIYVRPPGKELQNISLLSGGEKALTAIALLLSVFKTRPSPFLLLDEVDAALDEANNGRFNRLVTEFLKHSQFIVITHSKRTMQIADTLYGVTMQEPGVSRRVSVRFEDHTTQDSAVA
ncbi:MAG: chromosome segregation protein SMC, partial [Planctomycetes bacterium]|nr:chromosome segregation protein SMC [Planctomycetota bacterium]